MIVSERQNIGYTITDSVHIGDSEFVIGHNPKAVTPYVTWECSNGNNYFWGHYVTERAVAERDLLERATEARERQDRLTGYNKPNKERDAR